MTPDERREEAREYQRKWRAAHPGYFKDRYRRLRGGPPTPPTQMELIGSPPAPRPRDSSGLAEYQYVRNLRVLYSLSKAEYDAKVDAQEGRCAICRKSPEERPDAKRKVKRLSVDHNHRTNVLRDLLCRRCNLLVGFLEGPHVAEAAAYLMRHGVNVALFLWPDEDDQAVE